MASDRRSQGAPSAIHPANEFGSKLHSLRIAKRMTLKELSAHLGYSTHAYLSEIESGRKVPTVAFVLKVARLFGVTTDELLKDELPLRVQPHA